MSRILTCECGYYVSFGEGKIQGWGTWDDPFYKYNPKCPSCEKYLRGESNNKISFEEFCDIMADDVAIVVMTINTSNQTVKKEGE